MEFEESMEKEYLSPKLKIIDLYAPMRYLQGVIGSQGSGEEPGGTGEDFSWD